MVDVLFYVITVVGKVVSIITLLAITLVIIFAYGRYSAFKLLFGTPWLVWLTLDDVVAMGHSRFWCEILLPIFYRGGNFLIGCTLLIRLRQDLPDPIRMFIAERGFQRDTVQYHEFKFTSPWKSRRGKLQKSRVEILQPTPMRVPRRTRL